MSYKIVFTKQAQKDFEKVKTSNVKDRVRKLLELLKEDPLQPPREKLTGLESTYSKRINIQHRLVYEVFEAEKTVKVIRMWTHYGDN